MTARIKPKTILIQRAALDSEMARHVRAAHPGARVEVIPFATHAYNGKASSTKPEDHWREKRQRVAVLSRRAKWRPDPNGRSTDFLPSVKLGTGCGFFCQYCYTERSKPNNYPKVYADALNMVGMIEEVADNPEYWQARMPPITRQRFERARNPKHKPYITFDIGCDTDCALDNQITRHENYPGHVIDIMNRVSELRDGMTSFASKADDFQPFIEDCTHPERNRIRLSLMPEWQRRILELNTASIENRLHAVNRLVAAGFEVHINLSPIVVTDTFDNDYRALLRLIDDVLSAEAKRQMAYEVIFLTHAPVMHAPVAARRPDAHTMMTRGPLPLAPKPHKPTVTTYTLRDKAPLKRELRELIERNTPYAHIRYMF